MSRGHEVRVATAPGRSLGYLNTSSSSSYEREEITQRGYLNRKCEGSMGRKTKVLHREKNWQLFWCSLKGTQLELSKIDGLKLKPGEPPPKDIIQPTSLMKSAKMELMNIDGALVELDYVSQENKDIQKRRKCLFRVVLQNDVEYIMQAPNMSLRKAWVSALQAIARDVPAEEEVMVGHAIKASRDSLKHVTKNKQRNKRSTVYSASATGSTEESEYVEFSTAEAMVEAGGDPRLQALRKRLQAKKELLKQLNRMYTSFLGGNAAAMYDETLILTQIEPPTFDSGSPILSTTPPIYKKQIKKTYQVVHRKLPVSDSTMQPADSFDGMCEKNQESVCMEEDKRASTGEMNVLTSISPIPLVKEDVLETELLMDYYLVPGAVWSVLRKGERVQIIGRAKDTGWYRCMALRDSNVKLDKAPFAFLKSISKRQSGITPELIEEEYSWRSSSDIDPLLKIEREGEGLEQVSSPPPLMPRFSAAPNSSITENSFPEDMEIVDEEDALKKLNGDLREPLSGGPSPDLSEVSSSMSREDSKMPLPAEEAGSDVEKKEAEGDDVETPIHIERRHSYQLATEDMKVELQEACVPDITTTKELDTAEKSHKKDAIQRSSSAADTSSQAAIKLRKNLDSAKSPRAVSTTSVYSGSLYNSSLEKMSSAGALSPRSSQISLEQLIEREVNTHAYPTPLIGCIPPSALKCFANKNKKKGSDQSPLISPAHSHSDVSMSESLNGGSRSLPVSDPVETPAPSDQSVGMHAEKMGSDTQAAVSAKSGVASERKHSNARLIALRDESDSERSRGFSVSVSMDDDSDGEADRRQALIFKQHQTITPEEDEAAVIRKHVRAKSLPPPMKLQVDSPPDPEQPEEESSLDRRPSYLRMNQGGSISPDPSVQLIPPCQSVGSSPIHKVNANGKVSASPSGAGDQPISNLFDSSNRPGILKKLFARKSKSSSKLTTSEHASLGRISPGPPPGLLKQVLLGNVDLYDDEYSRTRLSSASGRPVLQKGMGIIIGDESSSESEQEEDEEDEEQSNAPSLCVESSVSLGTQELPCNGCSTPTSPKITTEQDKHQVFLSLDQARLAESISKMKANRDYHTPEPVLGKLRRSASDHGSLKLKAKEEDQYLQPGSSSSLKRNMNTSLFAKKARKPRAMTTPGEATSQLPIKKNRLSKKRKKNLLANGEVENSEGLVPVGTTDQDTSIKISGIFRQPPRGEKRFVYLDPSLGKYGFRLQSYGRFRDQGKVLQTFVQSVVPGSPSFMAGLYPGDAIVEVNGEDVKYAPVEGVVEAIQKGGKGGERVALKVEFVDGVTRLECMQRSDEFKNDIKMRQRRLEELRDSEESMDLSSSTLFSPQHITPASQLPVWNETLPTFEPVQHKFPHNRQLNQMVAVHCRTINTVDCDVLVMPISSCYKPKDRNDKNILLQLLRTGGPELLDDLSLAKQCKIGENISTWGHHLPAKYVYHCVFGDLEESLQSCCHNAMGSASAKKLRTIVFWLDGFASLSVSPQIIIDAVRNWLQQDIKRNIFDRVVFSSKANSSLVEELMHISFPLYPCDTVEANGTMQNGTESHDAEALQAPNGTDTQQNITDTQHSITDTEQTGSESLQREIESPQDSLLNENPGKFMSRSYVSEIPHSSTTLNSNEIEHNEDKEGCISTEDLLESLDALQDENMKTFEEIVGKLAESKPEPSPDWLKPHVSPCHSIYSRSLPSGNGFSNQEARSISPSNRVMSQSGDLILNPDRTESDV